MCGTPNKLESVFCASCGARLVPLTAAPEEEKPRPSAPPIKGLSLPALESPGELPAEFQKIEDESTPKVSNEKDEDDANWIDKLRGASLEEDVPDWLKSVAPPSESKAPSQEEPTRASEIPDWLQKIRPTELPAEEPARESEDESAIPDWLKSASEEKEPPVTEETVSAQEEPQTEPPVEPEPQVETPIAEATSFETFETPTEQEPRAQAETPIETTEIQEPQAEPSIEAETPQPEIAETIATPAAEEELPDWLKEIEPAQPQAAEPVTTEATTTAESLVEALEDKSSTAAPIEEIAKPAWAMEPSPAMAVESEEDIPDWLRTPPSGSDISAAPAEVLAGEAPAPALQPALPEEVPDWLAALKPGQTAEEEPVETSGPLEGLRGVLPIALAMTEPHAAAKSAQPIVKTDGRQIFESILAAPRTEAVTPVAPVKRRVWTMRPVIYLVLALAALIPFFLPSDWATASLPISKTPAAELYDTIQTLPANSTVLVAFDYDPSQSGEMDLQASAILRHLVQRRVKIITVSTLETGALIAKRVLDNVTQNLSGYTYGTNFVNLGFLPGHEAALSQLVNDGFSPNLRDFGQNLPLNNQAGFSNVRTLRDIAMIVELAGSEDVLRNWMEQVQPRTSVKIVAGVSAGVEPRAQVYHNTPSKQLAAMVSGLVGAAQYEILANQPGAALGSINAQAIAQLAVVLMIIVGNLVYLLSRGRTQNAGTL